MKERKKSSNIFDVFLSYKNFLAVDFLEELEAL